MATTLQKSCLAY